MAYAPGQTANVEAPIEKIPAFQRGGSIIPRKTRLRRSATLMINDPYTLVVALDSKQEVSFAAVCGNNSTRNNDMFSLVDVVSQAFGLLYMDDEKSFNYQKGQYRRRHLAFSRNQLSSSASKESPTSKDFQPHNTLERLVILGLDAKPTAVVATDAQGKATGLTFKYDDSLRTLTVRKPDLLMAEDWSIKLQ